MKRLVLLLPAAALLAACASPSATAFYDGVRLFREGYYGSARDAFDTAVRLAPRQSAAWHNRAVARARLGDLDGAVVDYTYAARLAPNDPEIYFHRGNAYAAAGNLPEAIKDFTSATSIRPTFAKAYFNRGTVRAAAGDVTGAVTDWQWAVEAERDPWTKAAMARGVGLDYAYASPAFPAVSGGVVMSPSPSGPAQLTPPPPPSPTALTPEALDVRALVARAMGREIEGDRAGAIADLRAALTGEADPARRARIDRLLRVLEASR